MYAAALRYSIFSLTRSEAITCEICIFTLLKKKSCTWRNYYAMPSPLKLQIMIPT